MKKKQKSSAAAAAAAASAAPGSSPPATSATAVDLKTIIRDHSLFFDKLVEHIPAKFYLSNDDADSKPWFQGLSKAQKASSKKKTRANIRKARRDRLDPEKAQTSTLDLLRQSIKTSNLSLDRDNNNGEGEKGGVKPFPNFNGGDVNREVTYEELRQKLHRKMELLRGNRGSGGKLKDERNEKDQPKKRKRSNEFEKKGHSGNGKGGNLGKSEDEIEKDVNEATKGIEFGKLRIGREEDDDKRRNKKRKMSKLKELERAKRLDEIRKEDPKMAEKHSWKAATSRAMGVKVHDDPRLLKESMKKEKKRHQKNAEKWKERVESRDKMKEEKQLKRADNISERIHQKKMRKIAKREKKLMRPGFEGRKEGYINED